MIVGIKEARPDMGRIAGLLESCPRDFCILSGDDGSCLDAILAGAKGVISVAANVIPDRMRDVCELAISGQRQQAKMIDAELRELFRILSIESNPIPVKCALAEMGLIETGIRLPLLPLDARHHESLRACLQKLQTNRILTGTK